MEKNEIEYYLNYILKPKLVQLKVSENYIIKIITSNIFFTKTLE